MRLLAASLVLAASLGCVTAPPVSSIARLPPDTADLCARHCQSIGLRLGAVVIIRDSSGCVCEPNATAARAEGGASAAAGGVAALMDEENAAQQAQVQQQHHSHH